MYFQSVPFKLESGKIQAQDGEKEDFDTDVEFKKGIVDIPLETLENGKRPCSDFCAEVACKRAKQEDRFISFTSGERNSSEEPVPAFVVDVSDRSVASIDEDYLRYAALEQREGVRSPLPQYPFRRWIPIGSGHQADLPTWTPWKPKSSCRQSRFCYTDSWDPSSVMDCGCGDEGSIMCVQRHVKEAREKIRREFGQEKFVELGFLDMGEDVAEGWTKMEDNLFRMVVSSNSASLGRNFWAVLPRAFPSRSFGEIVSYYFNVFVLRKRAAQNRLDPVNADSDDDDWRQNSRGEFVMQEEGEYEEDEDSLAESPADANRTAEDVDVSDDSDSQNEVDDDEFYGGKPVQTSARNSADCSLDQDVQDDSCTSVDRLYNPYTDHGNSHKEHTNFEYFDGDCDSKPWELSYVGGAGKDFDFFPTCNVLEQVFGKGSSWDKDDGDGSDFR